MEKEIKGKITKVEKDFEELNTKRSADIEQIKALQQRVAETDSNLLRLQGEHKAFSELLPKEEVKEETETKKDTPSK